jgi:hypothetical protein
LLTENGMGIDHDAMNELLAQADVLTIGFTLFPQRLLIDTRATESTGPLVTIVDPVASVQERYLWLGRHRGMFGAPKAFSFFVWPHTVRGLIERDALRVMRERLMAAPGDGAEQLDQALAALRELENAEFRRAIRGEAHWKTLWEARPTT